MVGNSGVFILIIGVLLECFRIPGVLQDSSWLCSVFSMIESRKYGSLGGPIMLSYRFSSISPTLSTESLFAKTVSTWIDSLAAYQFTTISCNLSGGHLDIRAFVSKNSIIALKLAVAKSIVTGYRRPRIWMSSMTLNWSFPE